MDVLEATPGAKREFNAAEIGAIAHLYRGEVYRSTVWRTRLDNTTNWAVAGLGLAMSISFSHTEASALPILLMGGLMVVFLFLRRGVTVISTSGGRDVAGWKRTGIPPCCLEKAVPAERDGRRFCPRTIANPSTISPWHGRADAG